MNDITHKTPSLRSAIAIASLSVSMQETMDAVQNKMVPKGDIFEFSRAAGMLAVKNTSQVIPDCHPLPIEFVKVSHSIDGLVIQIKVEVRAIYRTGVEVEAMHGAIISALTIYDMLKPIDKNIEISNVKLDKKIGGKSNHFIDLNHELKCAIVVCSDSVSRGINRDLSGQRIVEKLQSYGLKTTSFNVISDNFHIIQSKAKQLCEENYHLILFTGGTGVNDKDVTPEAIEPLLDRNVIGIMEAARRYGQERFPYAMLSRGVAGLIGHTLLLTLPGSVRGVEETMDALFPYILHIFKVVEDSGHEAE